MKHHIRSTAWVMSSPSENALVISLSKSQEGNKAQFRESSLLDIKQDGPTTSFLQPGLIKV